LPARERRTAGCKIAGWSSGWQNENEENVDVGIHCWPVQPGKEKMAQKRMKLGEMLLNAGLINETQLEEALAYQRRCATGRLGATLVELNFLSEEVLLDFLSEHLKLPRIDLSRRRIPEDMLAYIPAEKAWEFRAIPVDLREMHGTIYLLVAMADPTNLDVIDALQFMTGCRVRTALAFDSAVEQALKRYYAPCTDPSVAAEVAARPAELPAVTVTRPSIGTTEERIQELLKILLEKGILSLRDFDRLK
jgi:type IV pilus assembly protein PilB